VKALGEAFSHFEKQAVALSGERGHQTRSGQRATVAGLLVVVLNGLGGALKEDQQPANFLGKVDLKLEKRALKFQASTRAFCACAIDGFNR
jgi:hypothetical protein